jgi:hypothetical protein
MAGQIRPWKDFDRLPAEVEKAFGVRERGK